MTLPFAEQINGQPTFFKEKILNCMRKYGSEMNFEHNDIIIAGGRMSGAVKLHTIREDKSNRWKEGSKIHAVYGNRTKNRRQIAPVFYCTGVQDIEIFSQTVKVVRGTATAFKVWIDGRPLKLDEVMILARNDGFNDAHDFANYFKSDFKGKLIHWTGLFY